MGLRRTAGATGRSRVRRGQRVCASLVAALVALSMLLSACGQDANQTRAEQSKAKLDAELQHARGMGIPDAMLQPVVSQEQSVAAGASGNARSWQGAADDYTLLYSQLLGIEQTAAQTLKQQTQNDLQAFSQAVQGQRAAGFSEINFYQARLDQAFRDFATASSTADYARVDAAARAQTAALGALAPAYRRLQDFAAAIRAVRDAGLNSSAADQQYLDDLKLLRDGVSPDRYQRLVGIIDGQIMQLMADQTEALPYIGSVLLDSFQARIDDLQRFGENVDALRRQHDDDVQELAAARTLADYLTVGRVINRQMDATTLQYWRGKARYDLAQLQKAIAAAQAQNPLLVYEYASRDVGVGIPEEDLAAARSAEDYQRVDSEITIMWTNLRALQDNMAQMQAQPALGPGDAHQADLDLMRSYRILDQRVIIISLREQVGRLYDNGKLVYWSYVTTGRPERPSPPGLHYVMDKEYHIEFTSPDPVGSPLWYAPTPINYALGYADGGYFLHDAWWRYKFGPGSNLPHWDPLAFNGGSHGCINFPETNMGTVYNFAAVGDPVLIY